MGKENNGEVRVQTKDELIENLRDQCKFWRCRCSDYHTALVEMHAELGKGIKLLQKLKKQLQDEV